MGQIRINQTFIKIFTLITMSIISFGFNSKFGLDSYSIYLNDKLVLKQMVNQPVSLRMLQLDKATENDQLRINYTHCTIKEGAGTARSITLRDREGRTVKKWIFPDATGQDLSMRIPVKELLNLEKAHGHQELSLYYRARELPKGEMLSMLRF